MRTNKYANINADVVYEGELKAYDKVRGNLDLTGQRTSNVPVGYFAYFEKKDGFSKLFYMPLNEVCAYAKQYSPTVKFNQNVTAQSLKEIALKQAGFSAGDGVGWLANFESMAIKTVLRQLLSKWGELSIENNDILSLDEAPCISAEELRDTEFSEAKVVATVDTTTGEIVQPGDEVSQPQPANPNPFKLN